MFCVRSPSLRMAGRVCARPSKRINGQAARRISNGKLHALRHVHIRPINLVIFQEPLGIFTIRDPIVPDRSTTTEVCNSPRGMRTPPTNSCNPKSITSATWRRCFAALQSLQCICSNLGVTARSPSSFGLIARSESSSTQVSPLSVRRSPLCR
jgi:hypothetical protein